jgi:LPS-assembly lipoprotein
MDTRIRMARRGMLLGAGGLALAGCGFRPLYGTTGDRAGVQEQLGEINVLLIPERTGQLLRQSLIARLERGGTAMARRYDLAVQFALGAEPIAIQPDNSSSRVRLIGTATWALTSQDAQRRTIASGSARDVDGYNIINQQFFAAELTSNAVQRRIVDALAEQITTQLAVHFSRQAG